jgi:4-hydroxythreonine-4-phosphate dehydrogenase
MSRPIRLALTLGDVGGIGPEICLKAAAAAPDSIYCTFIGAESVIKQEARRLKMRMPARWKPGTSRQARLSFIDPLPDKRFEAHPGKILSSASRAAVDWIDFAVEGCLAGDFDGMVTAPICKEGLLKAGMTMPGHTEYIAELCGVTEFGMMLMGGPLRVFLVTRHLPLSAVEKNLNEASVSLACRLTDQALDWLKASNRKIAVCGLNPHAGDGGAIGDAEVTWLGPLLNRLAKSLPVEGPLPADTVFYYACKKDYGAVIAMYHDQGLAPLKMLAFDTGVNLTLGLPIIRTSPDHGTAFDIAGHGVANPRSMLEAMKTAARLARRSNPWAKAK